MQIDGSTRLPVLAGCGVIGDTKGVSLIRTNGLKMQRRYRNG